MRVAIVGAGAVGRSIAGELLGNGHQVMLIEKDGRKVRMVAWRTPKAVYWISNSLDEDLTRDQMLAVAASLKRLGQK